MEISEERIRKFREVIHGADENKKLCEILNVCSAWYARDSKQVCGNERGAPIHGGQRPQHPHLAGFDFEKESEAVRGLEPDQ